MDFRADNWNVEVQTRRPVATSHSAGKQGGKERRGRRSSVDKLNSGSRGPTHCLRSHRIINQYNSLTSHLHSSLGMEATVPLLRLMRTNHPARLPQDKSEDSLFATFKPPLTFSLLCSFAFSCVPNLISCKWRAWGDVRGCRVCVCVSGHVPVCVCVSALQKPFAKTFSAIPKD